MHVSFQHFLNNFFLKVGKLENFTHTHTYIHLIFYIIFLLLENYSGESKH